ncbi:hypothetical protein BAE44_0000166 [Dichanthelium oligosanthes]|uniref:F-box/kelch-repeat protein n=1 Tax=Dichanthelium oligosanthes TaxID=888268 RepID=A0A1E5WN57_9POAL|nr:hypothetical protein BAE44_0000166 [Dichanthelium oligosanthes]
MTLSRRFLNLIVNDSIPGLLAGFISWHRKLLPPPPYLRDDTYKRIRTEISSYAVVGGGSHICISAVGAGTYCFCTVKHTWSKVGEWTLPFIGKAEYAPELKLWFGILATKNGNHILGAVDLSAIDSEPSQVSDWNLELDDDMLEYGRIAWDLKINETLSEWRDPLESQLVHLGSERFCIASSSHITRTVWTCLGNELVTFKRFAVFTGVEVMLSRVYGFATFKMVKHRSKCTSDVTLINMF